MTRPALGSTQPLVQWVLGFFPLGVKQLGHEVNHSLPSSAKVRNEWSSASTPHMCVHGVDKETLLFIINTRSVMVVFDLRELSFFGLCPSSFVVLF